ncbi:glycosyltransferase family 4 protein [Thermophagus xiamenensis]|uniref:Glycosyltransferase involved in cell wall bisynthesis n=1 Tax=Thermophagus xiamenensis TaxID=385682 RepID=A0A1I2DMT3_9BACT|nr:glycosyltransferase family 4 protein [Thermophagus xiamenensis]SFE81709.1 Glycosyltransferase involved in cell wall bisynthesis [Thermophagus xiamenensis]
MRIGIFRTFPIPLKLKLYNIQEIGLAKGLLKQGYSVDVFSFFEDVENTTIYYSYDGLRLRLIPLKGISIGGRISVIEGISKHLSCEDYDVIQVHETSQLMNAYILKKAKKLGIKTVLYQGVYQDYSGIGRFYQYILDTIFQKTLKCNSDYVFAKTTMAKKYLEKKGFRDIKVLPVGLDIDVYSETCFRNELVEEFTNNFENIFLYVGILEKRRNVSFLIDVLKRLSKDEVKGGKYGLLIIGQGPEKEFIKNLVRAYNLQNKVLIFDSIPNKLIGSVFSKCDLLLLPSLYEIFGMVVLEALYFGIPVFSTPTAGPKDIIKNYEYGRILDLDLDYWCLEIEEYLEHEKKHKRERCLLRRRFVKSHYNWDKISQKYTEIIGF